ncbi:MAG TPA: DUF2505 domain-containing protein [Mycobacteriales bacterium]|nr:DUF2505 domain-containing protein [Mycobacteriales bacterium]
MRKLAAAHHYETDPQRVFSALTDEAFLRAKFGELGARDVDVLECGPSPSGSGFRVVTRRTVSVDVPGFAKRLLSPSNAVTQTDVWGQAGDGVRTGHWSVEVAGVPSTMGGTMSLEASGAGSDYRLDGEVKVSVPLLGGKLEGFAVGNAERDIARECEFLARWLAERHP